MSAETVRLIFSGLVCGLGVLCGSGQLLCGRSNAATTAWERWDTPAGTERCRRRRRLGAAIVVLISLTFFLGVNFLSPGRSPVGYLIFWITTLLLVLWLCGLAMIDLLAIRRLQQRILASMREAVTSPPEARKAGSSPKTGARESDTWVP